MFAHPVTSLSFQNMQKVQQGSRFSRKLKRTAWQLAVNTWLKGLAQLGHLLVKTSSVDGLVRTTCPESKILKNHDEFTSTNISISGPPWCCFNLTSGSFLHAGLFPLPVPSGQRRRPAQCQPSAGAVRLQEDLLPQSHTGASSTVF